ncbi:DUF6678 family protein [Aquimarina sp. Aq107]|uniref:DUF6678 family protein n=1 Tax=Aquimarina sp. Aq107 TaxID=1191912 RepID=UPI000D55E142|nr:DUF6678 family protein [Aquimarina sp. Aq107]
MKFNKLLALIGEFREKPWEFRMKLFSLDYASNWSGGIWSPTNNYIEVSSCLTAFSDLENIQINPIEDRYIGRLVPNRIYDHTQDVCDILKHHDLEYEIQEKIILIKVQ